MFLIKRFMTTILYFLQELFISLYLVSITIRLNRKTKSNEKNQK